MQHYTIARLNKSVHKRAEFACGKPALDTYIKQFASQDERNDTAIVYVLTRADEPRVILGYYTLSAYAIDIASLPEDARRKAPKYPALPAALIGRLAVGSAYRGFRLGEKLLIDALRRCASQSEHLGLHAVVVDALDTEAVSFYERYGFHRFSPDSMKLYHLMKDVRASFSGT